MDHVEGRGHVAACHAAEKRHQLEIRNVHARQMIDAGRKRAAVTHADRLMHAAFDRQLEKAAA